MPSREDMISFLQNKSQTQSGGSSPGGTPSRDDMIAFLQNKSSAPMEDRGTLQTAVDKAASGASLGFADEASGAMEAGGRIIGLKGLGGKIKDIGLSDDGPTLDPDELKAAYTSGRDKDRAMLAQEQKQHPVVATIADLGGSVLNPVSKFMPGAGPLKTGITMGSLMGLGNSDADNLKDLAYDTGKGAVFGAASGKVADVASPYIEAGAERLGEGLQTNARNLGARAIGLERATAKKMGSDQVQKVGQYAIDNVLSPLSSTEDKIAANEATKTAAMNSRKTAYDTIDKAGASTFNPQEAGAEVQAKVLGDKNPNYQDSQDLAEILDPHLSNILSRGDENISMKEAQDLVESLGKNAKFDTSRSSQANDVAKSVYHSVRDSINKAASDGADAVGVPGLRQTIEDANEQYSLGKQASTLLKNKQAAETGNKIMGLTDTITGVGGYAMAGPKGLALLAAKKAAEKYGSQNAAIGLNKIANSLLETPEMLDLAQKSPGAFQDIVQRIGDHIIPENSLPAAADKGDDMSAKNQPPKPTKGPDKWANDGHSKLMDHAGDDQDMAQQLADSKDSMMADPKSKTLLVAASDLKPGSKAMEKILSQVKEKMSKGQ